MTNWQMALLNLDAPKVVSPKYTTCGYCGAMILRDRPKRKFCNASCNRRMQILNKAKRNAGS